MLSAVLPFHRLPCGFPQFCQIGHFYCPLFAPFFNGYLGGAAPRRSTTMHEPKPPPPNAPWPLVTSFGLSAFGLWPTSSHFLSFPRFPLAKKGKPPKYRSTNDLQASSDEASHKKSEKGSASLLTLNLGTWNLNLRLETLDLGLSTLDRVTLISEPPANLPSVSCPCPLSPDSSAGAA